VQQQRQALRNRFEKTKSSFFSFSRFMPVAAQPERAAGGGAPRSDLPVSPGRAVAHVACPLGRRAVTQPRRGGNALQSQIASYSRTAISKFQTPSPRAVLAPGPLQFQGVAGATVPPRPRLSGYVLDVLGAEMHSKYIKHQFQRPSSEISQLPPPNVSPRRPCALRGGCVIPQTPAVLWARLQRAPPAPCSSMPIGSPVSSQAN
jgi:hypothetical protein